MPDALGTTTRASAPFRLINDLRICLELAPAYSVQKTGIFSVCLPEPEHAGFSREALIQALLTCHKTPAIHADIWIACRANKHDRLN